MRTYLKAHCSSTALTDSQVIPSKDDGPKPTLPYIVVDVGLIKDVGEKEICEGQNVSEQPVMYSRSDKYSIVTVHGFGSGALDWIEKAEQDYILPLQQKTIRDTGLTMYPIGDILDLSSILDSGFEKHYVQDWRIDYRFEGAQQVQTELGTIQTTTTTTVDPLTIVDTLTLGV